MGCRGVHFALAHSDVEHLRSLADEQERLDYLQEEIEVSYFAEHPNLLAESDKSWDAMHRALSDGQLTIDGGEYPLNHVVLAGEQMYSGDDFIASLKTPAQVRDIAGVLPSVTEDDFRRRYFRIDPNSYDVPLSEEDFEYTWRWFQGVRDLFIRAAKDDRFVLFTVDQ